MSIPYSIRMFLPDGDPDGLRLIEKSNWTGMGVVFSRSGYKEALTREEFQRTGVYVLVGTSEESSLPTIYIGEGDPVRPRLDSHYAKKDFWNWGVFFVTSNQSLNKAHVKYMESRLIQLAKDAKQCNLDNSNDSGRPTLSEADVADMESFIHDMLKVFPLVGLSVFEKPNQTQSQREMLFIKAKGIKAKGYETSRGFVVVEGSEAVTAEVPSIHQYLTNLRNDLVQKGVLQEQNGHYVFAEDYAFSSPSTAAGVVLGRSSNGRTCWKNAKGKDLKAIQAANTMDA
ncbi:GIY-YIG nuclease family protein [Desulfovibrio oxyclinae]|uniref:GIY-YIG nuclease family protein n=1 Tax=Desulfovibrio oxyclinae TaxID=63560 RepID=UPI00035F3047|nr:GIY-YIG nuclease family protein [Desulfovibrio oxyclinae]